MGIRTAREGLRWHLIEAKCGQYDFSSAGEILDAADRQGVEIIWDLLHFGWPSDIDIFDRCWVERFSDFTSAFSRWMRNREGSPTFVAPINEISFLSWAGGDKGFLNPFATDLGAELKRQLVRGACQASNVLRTELPGVRLVSPEPVIHIVGDPLRPEDCRQAAEYRLSMFEAWDMLCGRAHPDLGGREENLDIIGVNYYDRNQWWNFGGTITRFQPEYRPFSEILKEVHQRYQRPMWISETGTEGEDRPKWLRYISDEVRAAMQAGVPIHGICLYPIVNHPGWDDDRHCLNGLWDYSGLSGEREIYDPLAQELVRNKSLESEYHETQYTTTTSN